MSAFFAISTIIFILLLLTSVDCSNRDSSSSSSSCAASSCGNVTNISFPFRLKTDPISCGYNSPLFELDCHNNVTVLSLPSGRYHVQEIDYDHYTIRLINPRLFNHCPTNALNQKDDLRSTDYYEFKVQNRAVVFVHCTSAVNASYYTKAADFCGNKSIDPFSQFYSYVLVGDLRVSDVEESCMVDRITGAGGFDSTTRVWNDSSLESIYDALSYGFELSWYRIYCDKKCKLRYQYCLLQEDRITCPGRLMTGTVVAVSISGAIIMVFTAIYGLLLPVFLVIYGILSFGLTMTLCGIVIGSPIATITLKDALLYWGFVGLLVLKFLIGFPILVYLVLCKWRRRHLSMDETIEEFLRNQNNLTPIKYSYSDISKMTNNFNQQLGEGRYGVVYKGKLRSGPLVAVKMMTQSESYEEEFINEVATIGHIHHANIVQLIGYCVEGSKCALVYEFLLNGSLDKYIFNQSLGVVALTYNRMFEIALGIARGIAYLHHGCEMQILHFDIKPHNILLDENFHPKISDFGLAKLHATNDTTINLTDVRGTKGYMAPEMFYKNIGGVSCKADIYSFGMLLMEMICKRKNMNPFAEHVSQIYFPSWVYKKVKDGKEIEIEDATIEEKRMINKIILVALWCIQMKPCDRQPMNKVVEMLEGDLEIAMPPTPFLAPQEAPEDDRISQTYRVDCVNLEVVGN